MRACFRYKAILIATLVLVFLTSKTSDANEPLPSGHNRGGIVIGLPDIVVQHVEVNIRLTLTGDSLSEPYSGISEVTIGGGKRQVLFTDGIAEFPYTFGSKQQFEVEVAGFKASRLVSPIPLWLSILPPLFAISMALIFREVISSLFIGLLTGTFIIWFYRGAGIFLSVFKGIGTIIDTYVPEAILDRGHVSIIIFSMMIGAMVNLITRNGGMKGVVNQLSRFASTPRSGQFATWLMGIAIFFDDYANTLVVGNTMRPLTDRLRISREKLAYIVDSTAAPVASVAFVTTWIGAQLSYISDGIRNLNLDENPYQVFIYSLQYAFYPFLALIFVLMIIWLKRDFGPMWKAEVMAQASKQIKIDPEVESEKVAVVSTQRWYNAAIPVFVVVAGTIAGLIITGNQVVTWQPDRSFAVNLSDTIGQADTYKALLWSSLAATLVAILITTVQGLLTFKECIESLLDGFRSMLTAIVILVMAWSIALITQHLHTADFISQSLLDLQVSPYLIPAITFVFASGVAFSTGTSWGTMAILYPLILPATWLISKANGFEYNASMALFHNVVSCVLSGAVLGDHVSPISDTTILSSLASSCNHIEHVRTQMPYALTVGVIAVVAGTIPVAYGMPVWMVYIIAVILMIGIIRVSGRKTTALNNKTLHDNF